MEPYEAEQKPSIVKPVIIAGVIGGILGLIPPLLYCNFCCCLWYAVSGIIAVLIYRAMAPYALTPGLGALMGLISGLISGVTSNVALFFLVKPLITNPEFYDSNSEMSQQMANFMMEFYKRLGIPDSEINQIINQFYVEINQIGPEGMLIGLIKSFLIIVIIGTIVSTIAGVITAAISGKREKYPVEPPLYQP